MQPRLQGLASAASYDKYVDLFDAVQFAESFARFIHCRRGWSSRPFCCSSDIYDPRPPVLVLIGFVGQQQIYQLPRKLFDSAYR